MRRKKERGRQVKRILVMIQILTTYHFGRTIEDLAKSLRVGWRTIRRDLTLIGEAGIKVESYGPIYYGKKKYRIKGGIQLRRAMGMN